MARRLALESSPPYFICFVGGGGPSPPEQMVARAKEVISLDLLSQAQASRAFGSLLLVGDRPELAEELPPGAEFVPSPSPFHFGQCLRDIVLGRQIERPFYLGGGYGALLSLSQLKELADESLSLHRAFLTNNLFSTDFIAFHPGSALSAIEPPEADNPLAQRLRLQAGLQSQSLPRNAATQFDVDTPTDLLILKLHPQGEPRTRAYLDSLRLDTSSLEAIMGLLVDPTAEVVVAGRASSYVWAHLEEATACRVRLFSEERGLRGDERPQAHSLLGYYIEAVGVKAFFDILAHLGQGAIIDSRVLFAHRGYEPSAADRFYSDLGQAEKISDPFVAEFTTAARAASIPVVLGGHSLVSGGLYALIDAAWQTKDRLQAGKEASHGGDQRPDPA